MNHVRACSDESVNYISNRKQMHIHLLYFDSVGNYFISVGSMVLRSYIDFFFVALVMLFPIWEVFKTLWPQIT